MDHHLSTPSHNFSSVTRPVTSLAGTASSPTTLCILKAGRATTLRAKELSVLRITHGRVWATLTDVGPYSRVQGGDHFLSRGESLTLLPGQQLVMESFGIGHAATASFSWENACAAAIAVPAAATDGAGVLLPLRDLRHALGLVVGATGRLLRGLAHGTVLGLESLATSVAMIFVARSNRKIWTNGAFNASKGPASTPLGDWRSL